MAYYHFYTCDDQTEKHTIGLNIGFYLNSEKFGSGFLKPKHKKQAKRGLNVLYNTNSSKCNESFSKPNLFQQIH